MLDLHALYISYILTVFYSYHLDVANMKDYSIVQSVLPRERK